MNNVNDLLSLATKIHSSSEYDTYRVDLLSVDAAKLLLAARSASQRNLRDASVSTFENALKTGQYHALSAFVVNSAYKMVDGQHRLTAVVRTGIPVKNVIIHHIKDDSIIDVVDTGKSRTQGDVASLLGLEKLPLPVTAAINFETKDNKAASNDFSVSSREIRGPKERHLLAASHVFKSELIELSKLGAGSAVLAASIRCMRKDKTEAFEFFKGVLVHMQEVELLNAGKLAPEEMSAVSHIQRKLAMWLNQPSGNNLRGTKKGSPLTLRDKRNVALTCIKQWNEWRAGTSDSVQQIKLITNPVASI